jgi:lipoyl(octanoyl) transferase
MMGATTLGSEPGATLSVGPIAPLSWQLWVDDDARPGWANMAYDAALLDQAAGGSAVLRLYRWQPWCLSFGRNEPALRRYDRNAILARGLDTVRRPTGGRAVWHAEELTYAVAAPASAFGDLARAYRLIHAMLQRAVRSLGVPAQLAPAVATPRSLDAGACFANPVGGEVMTAAGKLVGSAQLRQDGALLQHGSLLLSGTQDVVSDVARGSVSEAHCTTLAAELGRPVSFDEVVPAVVAAAGTWPGAWHELRGPSADVRVLAGQHAAQFQSSGWTWRR